MENFKDFEELVPGHVDPHAFQSELNIDYCQKAYQTMQWKQNLPSILTLYISQTNIRAAIML